MTSNYWRTVAKEEKDWITSPETWNLLVETMGWKSDKTSIMSDPRLAIPKPRREGLRPRPHPGIGRSTLVALQ